MSTAVTERAAPADLTPAQRQRARLDQFMGAIEKRQDQIGTLLSDSGIDPRLFLETCRRSLMRDPELVNCDPGSFIQAALNCAGDGLVPDGRKAAIVRFKGQAQYMPMYQGLLDVAYRSGQFKSIEAQVVYEGDEFDYDMGDNPFIRHKRPLESTSTKIIGAYCIAKTTNGGIFREVMGAGDLAKVRAVSRATKGPNIDWPGEMARKAPLRRQWKFLPKTPAMDRVAIHDDATYDQAALAPPGEHTRTLKPGFNPPALTHQPGDEVPVEVDTDEAELETVDAIVDTPADEPVSQNSAADEAPVTDYDSPAEWLVDAKRWIKAAPDIPTLKALDKNWTDTGRWLALKAHSKTDAAELQGLMEERAKEIEAANA